MPCACQCPCWSECQTPGTGVTAGCELCNVVLGTEKQTILTDELSLWPLVIVERGSHSLAQASWPATYNPISASPLVKI